MDNEQVRRALAALNAKRQRLIANQTAATAGTTAIPRPVQMPFYNRMDDSQAYNNVIANIANKFDFKTSDMNPAEYNRLAGVFETMQSQYGRPKIYDFSKLNPEDSFNERPYFNHKTKQMALFSPKQQNKNNCRVFSPVLIHHALNYLCFLLSNLSHPF